LRWNCILITLACRFCFGGGARLPGVTGSEQVIEQRPEVDHRLAKLFGAGLSATSTERDLLRRSIILDHVRVLDRYVSRPLFEIRVNRIASVAHHSLNQLVGLADSCYRLIHEVALRRSPLLQVAFASGRLQGPDLEPADSLAAIRQLLLGGLLIAALCHDAAVFWAELIPKSPGPLLTRNKNPDDH